nr:MAG TPA: Methylmalonic aciduria and homocystinuria type B12, Nitro-FMN-reductase, OXIDOREDUCTASE.9A [Caudoviricetes sp.]
MYPLRFHPSYGYAAYCGTSFFLAPPDAAIRWSVKRKIGRVNKEG